MENELVEVIHRVAKDETEVAEGNRVPARALRCRAAPRTPYDGNNGTHANDGVPEILCTRPWKQKVETGRAKDRRCRTLSRFSDSRRLPAALSSRFIGIRNAQHEIPWRPPGVGYGPGSHCWTLPVPKCHLLPPDQGI